MPRLPRPRHHSRPTTRPRRHGRLHRVETLESRQLLSLADWPTAGANGSASITVGDFNRDGLNDSAQVGPSIDGLSIKLGQPDGSLSAWRSYLPGTYFNSVAVGDFDADGKLDLAVVRPHRDGLAATGLVAVLLGRGDGQFTLNSTAFDDLDPTAILAADLDGDNKLDLATANTAGVSVRLGRGDGTFQAPTLWGNIPTRVAQIAVGDISGDGKPDIVASSYVPGKLVVLVNSGNGTFPAVVTTDVAGQPGLLTIGDVDGDGKNDVVTTGTQPGSPIIGLNLYRNKGFNTFEKPSHYGLWDGAMSLAFRKDPDAGATIFWQTSDLASHSTPLKTWSLNDLKLTGIPVVLDGNYPYTYRYIASFPTDTSGNYYYYWATIDWGDGTTSSGSVSASSPTGYIGSYVPFTTAGRRTVTVTLYESRGETTTASFDLDVIRAPDVRAVTSVPAYEGEPLKDFQLAYFAAPRPDAVASQFRVQIDWGDGTVSDGQLQTVKFPDVVDPATGRIVPPLTIFYVVGTHTYTRPTPWHDYVSIHVTDTVTGIERWAYTAAYVQGWPLLLHDPEVPVTATAGSPFGPAALAIIEQNGFHGTNDYRVSIDWGDGSRSPGTVALKSFTIPEAPYPTNTFRITAGHTYAAAGTYTYTVNVTGRDGETASHTGTILVAAAPVNPPSDPPPVDPPVDPTPIPLTAKLDPASDSGPSNSDGITNVRQPVFNGTANPGTVVQIAGLRLDGGAGPIVLGRATADTSGNWSITSIPLADGRYTLGLTVQDPQGNPVAPLGLPDLVIDTIAPRVVGASLVTKAAGGVLVLQDDRSGLDPATLQNPAAYNLVKKTAKGQRPVYGATSVTVGEATPIGTRAVTLAFKKAGKLKSASNYLGTHPGAITDLAGNVLDGEFLGKFPSGGTSHPGNSFVALFKVDARGKPTGPLDPTPPPVKPRKKGR